jgi:hypothetical protein
MAKKRSLASPSLIGLLHHSHATASSAWPRWYTSGAMKRLPCRSALCASHRRVVGSDDRDELLRWVYDHMPVHGCPVVDVEVSERIVGRVESEKVLAP